MVTQVSVELRHTKWSTNAVQTTNTDTFWCNTILIEANTRAVGIVWPYLRIEYIENIPTIFGFGRIFKNVSFRSFFVHWRRLCNFLNDAHCSFFDTFVFSYLWYTSSSVILPHKQLSMSCTLHYYLHLGVNGWNKLSGLLIIIITVAPCN